MARIDSYTTIRPTPDDYLLGTDNPGGAAPTRNFTVQSIIDLVDDQASGNTNDYLDGITVESGYAADSSDTATITFSVGSQADATLNLGGAAFKAANHYALATDLSDHIGDTTQPHSLDSIVGAGAITAAKLSGNPGNGTSGQVLLSDGTGGFSWGADSDANDNYYLSAIAKSGTNVVFTVTGGSPVTTDIFKEGAFLSKAEIRADIKNNNTFVKNDFTFLGNLSEKNTISTGDISENSINASKIQPGVIGEDKLNISNAPVDGYVLTADGTDGAMQWAANSSSNYYISGISRNNSTLTFEYSGGYTPSPAFTYTFGSAAFADIGSGSGQVAGGDHTHSIGDLTNAGALASKDSVGVNEIANRAVTLNKLSPATAGTDGQVLSVNSSNELVWVNASGTVVADVRLLPSSIGDSASDTPAGYGGQVLRVNAAGTLVEYVDLRVQKGELATGNVPAAGKVLGLDANNDMHWIDAPTASIGGDSITPTKISVFEDGLVSNVGGHILVSNGTVFDNVPMSGDVQIDSTGLTTIQPIGPTKISVFDDSMTSTTSGHILVSDGTNFRNVPMSGDVQIDSTGATTVQAIAPTNISVFDDTMTSTTAGDLLVSNGTTFDNVTMSGDATITSEGELYIGERVVVHGHLANEFTARDENTTLSSSTPGKVVDFNLNAVYEITLPADSTDITIHTFNAEIGMTKIIVLNTQSSAHTGSITFFGLTETSTFIRLSSDDIVKDANTTNYIQMTCINKTSNTATYIYTVGTAQT